MKMVKVFIIMDLIFYLFYIFVLSNQHFQKKLYTKEFTARKMGLICNT